MKLNIEINNGLILVTIIKEGAYNQNASYSRYYVFKIIITI